ncbi:acetoacetate decarboxylase family protein [Pseudonocardia sp. N23]|uniref:acetoacetate decarboxylase family protein n=1 Tax=Pseudonocardia sp. N23 TaxID=1987376 RepID=UPI000BFD1AB6|nr:acetoacetate decarboxylase family protein [Pseudonocardia sp. N23]GAY12896.1 possible acetoacetate decarboxylase [Pseudonocardia sp. N23]
MGVLVESRTVTFPVRIADAAAVAGCWVVRAADARTLLRDTELDVAAVAGRTLAVLALLRYRVNDLGAYDELGLAVPVRHRGRVAAHVLQLPVTAPFTMAAGRQLWGLPKWLADADLSLGPRGATARWDTDGHPLLDVALRTSPVRLPITLPARLTTVAPRGDVVLHSRVRGRARGLRIGVATPARLVAHARHPLTDALGALRLTRRPLLTVGIEHLSFDMDEADEVP